MNTPTNPVHQFEATPTQPHPKSDIKAKTAYKAYLEQLGTYEVVAIAKAPADIVAISKDKKHYFEIKATKRTPGGGKPYFGAATITEWQAALNHPDSFWFVIAIETDGDFEFRKYTPEQFMSISTIPPFKIFFSYDLKEGNMEMKKTKSVRATLEKLNMLADIYKQLGKG